MTQDPFPVPTDNRGGLIGEPPNWGFPYPPPLDKKEIFYSAKLGDISKPESLLTKGEKKMNDQLSKREYVWAETCRMVYGICLKEALKTRKGIQALTRNLDLITDAADAMLTEFDKRFADDDVQVQEDEGDEQVLLFSGVDKVAIQGKESGEWIQMVVTHLEPGQHFKAKSLPFVYKAVSVDFIDEGVVKVNVICLTT